jgi:GT2 family glycosyltransferase/glycosyltransferase involved in cell wall biosynthesis
VPTATVVESETNAGFAGGCNLGVGVATGEFVAFINNDARPDARWVAAAVEVLDHDRDVACVASKVLDWEGRTVDFVDGSVTWFGMGYKREVGRPDSADYDEPRDVLFATGAAMVVRADVFEAVGGFDERFFMFYEDVDLGWRLNLLGYRVRYEPTSIAYHRHHASMKSYGEFRESYLLERNALMTMFKNYGDEALAQCLPAAMALSVRRSVARSELDARMLDLQVSPGGDSQPSVEIPKDALTGPLAIDYLVENMATLARDRRELQSRRRRSDADLFPLFRQILEPAYGYPAYLSAYSQLVEAFRIEDVFARRRRVAIVTGEPLGSALAGPAIRALEMAKILAVEHEVQLVTLGSCSLESKGFEVRSVGRRELRSLADWADVIVFQGILLTMHPWLAETSTILVADIYDPFHLEVLEQERARDEERRLWSSKQTVEAVNKQLSRADFMLCASAKQRDLWLGHLASLGRVNPLTYDDDESLGSLVAVAPFGLSDTAPRRSGPGIKGVLPGVGPDDKVVLWGGGVYNWFDPLTLIRAIDQVRVRVPEVRLVFLGMRHPNPGVPTMEMADRARALSDSLGLTGRFVFFNESWVDYADRPNFLLDADLGVSCHYDHVETEFSFRTRILDYLWAALPIVCTGGDSFGDLVRDRGLGVTVPPEDVDALSAAIAQVLTDPEFAARCAARSAEVAREFTWANSLRPLVEFCRSPRRAADLVERVGEADLAKPVTFRSPRRADLRADWELARQYWRDGGVSEVVRRASGRLRRKAT